MKNSSSFAPLLTRPCLRDEIDRELAQRHLNEFVRQAWPIVEPSTPFVPGWHIDAIIEHIEAISNGEIRNLVINVPPRHMKSLLVSVFWPAWEWIRWPSRRWLFASYAESLAIRDNVRSRRLIQSGWYQANWGNSFRFAGDQNEKRKIETNKGGHRIAVGTGGSATGEGGDRLIIDDPHNIGEIESTTVRKGVLEWFDQVWSTRANDPKHSAKVIIMQRCHSEDLAGHVLERGGWEHLSIPAEFEGATSATSIHWSDPRRAEGELIWPERIGPTEIEEAKRTLGSFGYAGQYQQRPVPASGGVWKASWFRFYAARDLPVIFDTVVDSWDCAFKDTDGSDYVCGQRWGRIGPDFYLIAQVWKKMDMPETFKAVLDFREGAKHLVNAVLIEDKANGPGVISMAKKRIPGVLAVNPEGGKVVRAHGCAPTIEAGNVYLPMPQEQPWVDDLVLEYCTFPNARHDDRVDATSQAIIWLTKNDLQLFAAESVGSEIDYDDDEHFYRPSPWRM